MYGFIKRLKMDQSAVDIKLVKDKPITDIGLDYGYSPSNYSSAFKKHHHISSIEFRKSTNVKVIQSPFYPGGLSRFDTFEGYAGKMKYLTNYFRLLLNQKSTRNLFQCLIRLKYKY